MMARPLRDVLKQLVSTGLRRIRSRIAAWVVPPGSVIECDSSWWNHEFPFKGFVTPHQTPDGFFQLFCRQNSLSVNYVTGKVYLEIDVDGHECLYALDAEDCKHLVGLLNEALAQLKKEKQGPLVAPGCRH